MTTDTQPSLYERLGGRPAIHAFASAALRKGMAHPDIGYIWQHRSEDAFFKEHAHFVDFLCAAWGGDAVYTGRDMATVHRGMGLTDVHWAAMFDTLEACYIDFEVPREIADEINTYFEQFKPVVIGSPDFREVVLAHPDMDPTQGMKSVGIHWPKGKSRQAEPASP
ncbi:MAG: group 1 truncated hemoglobin [Pseudomonadota bacterium]